MIDIRAEDVVLERRTSTGRFVLFTLTDLPEGSPIPWWGVTFDIGGDGHGILVRLDHRQPWPGWTAFDLLDVAITLVHAEQQRRTTSTTTEAWGHLCLAAAFDLERTGEAGRVDITYDRSPMIRARLGGTSFPLCSDPRGTGDGVTAEQVMIVLDQLYADAGKRYPGNASLKKARQHVGLALAAENRRIQAERRRQR